ncbi:hypothetical protein [uncultured Pseudacidovorax sp.]|uniref:hypothetical protein n=1 Tax=uncultured Pseudacidovorax sp. TaxID=679313 RepID=UPI0025D14BB1|nr:hypothetical protein [uncultured Pseudacidovorax sp.]
MSPILTSPRFLSRVMWLDATSCLLTGAIQCVATASLAARTGLPAPLLGATGLFLLVYAAAAGWMASRAVPPRILIGLVAIGNLGWAFGCLVLLFGSRLQPTVVGEIWVGLQVVVVLALAAAQGAGLRATSPRPGPALQA